MEELKPCPFCGGEAGISDYWVYCVDCGVGYEMDNIDKTITAWNTRTTNP